MNSIPHIPLPTPEEMTLWDAASIRDYGIRGEILMENASREALHALVEETGSPEGKRVILFAGSGNNGGDAYALARHLHDLGAETLVLHTRPRRQVRGDSGFHLRLAERTGVRFLPLSRFSPSLLADADIIVDGLLGTGFRGKLRSDYAGWVEAINSRKQRSFIFAIDIPSGLDGLSGEASPPECSPEQRDAEHGSGYPVAVRAHATVTFEAAKIGLHMPGAEQWTGRLHVRPIGIPRKVREELPASAGLLGADIATVHPDLGLEGPGPDMHKGTAGHLLILGGSPGMTGAPLLTGLGGLRSGAGLVTIGAPSALCGEIRQGHPELMTLPLGSENCARWEPEMAERVRAELDRFDAVVLGPGFGRADGAAAFVTAMLEGERPPCVLDADALYHLAFAPDRRGFAAVRETDVLTPHPGEMARLCGTTAAGINADRFGAAGALAGELSGTVVLKGAGTVIARQGHPTLLSPFCEPNLAVAGSGDVLAGLIGSLLARGIAPLPAACLGVYCHGLCGRVLRRTHPARGSTALEIAAAIPLAMKELLNANR